MRSFAASYFGGFIVLLILCFASLSFAAEVMPPKPSQYVNDYAGVMSKSAVAQLNQELEQFEKDTSNQILVAIYPKMQSDSSVSDYTVRIANSWKAGQKKRSNGAILFVFIQNRKMFIQVGYGLEGALPDATCNEIIDRQIKPRFKQGDYTGGVTAGVHAMMAATRGEYKGTGQTVNGARHHGDGNFAWLFFLLLFVILAFFHRSTIYGQTGRRRSWFFGPGFMAGMGTGMMMGGRGGFGSGGGGGFGGGGGGFSGGGGSFGGGGAGGSW